MENHLLKKHADVYVIGVAAAVSVAEKTFRDGISMGRVTRGQKISLHQGPFAHLLRYLLSSRM
jgi:hypothetical protein